MTRSMKLVKRRKDGKFHLMVANSIFQDFILPNPIRTNLHNPDNYCYIHDPVPNQVPAHIPENVAAGGTSMRIMFRSKMLPLLTPTHIPHTFFLKMLQVHHPTKDPKKEIWHLPLLMTYMLTGTAWQIRRSVRPTNPKYGSSANRNDANPSPYAA